MDLNLLSTFIKVYQEQSYTKAAIILNISQAAVSQRIKLLEKNLNTQLFIRKGRSIEATAHAHYMITKLAPAENLVREALYKVGYKVYVQEMFVYDLARSNVNIINSPPQQSTLFDDIRARKVDLVIDLVTTNDVSIISELVSEEEMVIAVAANHPRIQQQLTEEQYYQEKHAAIVSQRHNLDIFTLLAENPEPRDIIYTANSMMTQLTFVANSEALGLTTKRLIKYARGLGLKFYPCPTKIVKARFQMLYHRANQHNAAHRQLRDEIKTILAST